MKILIVKTSSLGDIVQAFPVLEKLKQDFPNSSVDWVVERPFVSFLQAHPLIDQVLAIDSKKWTRSLFKKQTWKEINQFKKMLQSQFYDKVLDLQGNTKSACVTALTKSFCKLGFGWKTVPEWPNYLFTDQHINPPFNQTIQADYLSFIQNKFFISSSLSFDSFADFPSLLNLSSAEKQSQLKLNNFLKAISASKMMVCLGSQWTNKQMTLLSLQKFLKLIEKNLSVYFIFIWGSAAEHQFLKELTYLFDFPFLILEKSSLPFLQHTMQQMDCIFSMDSLPLHLAATTSTRTYSVFGPSSAKKYKPEGKQHGSFQGKCPYEKVFEKRCPILRTCPTGSCIKEIEVQELFSHFFEWWKE